MRPRRNDGLNVPLRPPGAEGVAVIGPIRDQAGQGRVAVFPQGPGLGAVVARRHAQVQGTAPAIRQDGDLGAAAGAAAAPRGIRLFLWGRARRAHMRAHDRAVQPCGG